MRVLRTLKDTDPAQPLTEFGIWMVLRETNASGHSLSYHDVLKVLVDRGYAIRTGRRGGYEWYITNAGLIALGPS